MNTYYPNPFGSSLMPVAGDALSTGGYPARYDSQMYAQMCVGQAPYGTSAPIVATSAGSANGTAAVPPPHLAADEYAASRHGLGVHHVEASGVHGPLMPGDWSSQHAHLPPQPLRIQPHATSLGNGADFAQPHQPHQPHQHQTPQRHNSTPNGGFPSSQSSSPGNAPFYPWMGVVGQ